MKILSSTDYEIKFLKPLYAGKSTLSKDALIVHLFEAAVESCFQDSESRGRLKKWANNSSIDNSVKEFSKKIYDSNDPMHTLLRPESLSCFNDIQKVSIAQWFNEEKKRPTRAMAFYLSIKGPGKAEGLTSCIKALCKDESRVEVLDAIYKGLKNNGNKHALQVAEEIVAKFGVEKTMAPYYWDIANAYFKDAHYCEAVKHCLLAIKADPTNTEAAQIVFDVLLKLGHDHWQGNPYNREAIQFYRWAYTIDSTIFRSHIPRLLKAYLVNDADLEAALFYKSLCLFNHHDKHSIDEFKLNKEEWLKLYAVFRTDREKTLEEVELDRCLKEKDLDDEEIAVLCGISYELCQE